ncbi:MAG: tRNA glutamyl-Q(34) synthetase GluQRS [Betaproteobacteria bacterium RIFCSPLOWO2_12_FULL_62_58]|nr:MAG: tRNA glutamyl-Q(34) synthetase GluQRS [Betaproteobacteria bacterium RIFCSPLOWO2_12_FULL_62_58]
MFFRIRLWRMERYRGRFAPSPTGPLHFGSLVAAVGSYLEAKTHGGEWLVRIEDLDPPRVVPGAIDEILRTLEACGMHWDGDLVRQSSRDDAYHAALHELKQRGLVYPCACSRREITDSAVSGIEGHVYPGTCRAGLPSGKTARALRLDTRGARIEFDDALQGRIRQNIETETGDFIVYRADRVFAYQLAVVIDDAEQGITDVVRGADLLDSTPRQIYLQRLLGRVTPRYAHLPLAVNAQGEKLSKQTLAPAIDPRRPVPQLAATLRFLGHEPPHDLGDHDVSSFWQWAHENWDVARVPRARTLPAPATRDW